MGMFQKFKDDLAKMRQQLSENDILKEQEAQSKADITRLRIDRHHARQEKTRAEEQIKVYSAILDSADHSDPIFLEAQEGIKLCQEQQQKAIADIDIATQKINAIDKQLQQIRYDVKAAKQEIVVQFADSIRDDVQMTKEEMADWVVSRPEAFKARAEFTADLMTAKLHDLNDAMDTAIHESKDKGLASFTQLLDKVPAIDRVYRKFQIKHLEKEFERNEKIDKVLAKVEKTIDLKTTQVKEVGKAFKNLFTKWQEDPIQTPQDKQAEQLQEFNKEMTERKPGFLRRIINKDQQNLANELEGLYKAQIKSYEKTIERAQERADIAVDKGYKRQEEILNTISLSHTQEVQELAAKAVNISKEQVNRANDEWTR
ncbi:hypothetical protein [Butyrivibrio sp.]|uniref:hypothetical protein n=1 Tax=Butyrivibrio sp. TaxID=28121 RepID=UPI0025C4C025|nr:hypothetical protein [Butyrivibrio sp.]MBQ7430250.1 hypothetical protein [Butyrivibrio sp.]MBQ9303424.1 hypothetical protein [Butyrivibrio sp.]